MGSHVWTQQCPYCGFEEMYVSSYDGVYFDINCPICGYSRWTEEKVPAPHEVKLAKSILSEMDVEAKQNAIDLYFEDNLPFIARLKD